jgi:hypothetical protein
MTTARDGDFSDDRPEGSSSVEIRRIVNRYIGVEAGYLGDFKYRALEDFYPDYSDLEMGPWQYSNGTMREAPIAVLQNIRRPIRPESFVGRSSGFRLALHARPPAVPSS